jgi:Icc-related predicted phosphoesterase
MNVAAGRGWRVPPIIMKLLIFSDIHNDRSALERLMETDADYYICAGDLVSWARGLEACAGILRRRADKVYLLPGNHETAAQIASFAGEHGFHDFHGRSFEMEGHRVAGLGYSNPTPFDTPGEYSEEELAERLEGLAAPKPEILICHCPPLNTALDQVRQGIHAGSRAVREFIEKHQPAHFFCGHIHEAEGVAAEIGRTRAVNAGKRGFLLTL